MITRISLYLIDDKVHMPVEKRSSFGAFIMSDPVLECQADIQALASALLERIEYGNPQEGDTTKEIRNKHAKAALSRIGIRSWKQLYAKATYYAVDFKEDEINILPTGSSAKEGFFPLMERKTVWNASTTMKEIAQWIIDDYTSRQHSLP